MSFLIDPPMLFFFGVLVYLLGNAMQLSRLAKIAVGSFIVLVFIVFSTLLYFDAFRCVFPFLCYDSAGNQLLASEFMWHTNWQEQLVGLGIIDKVYFSKASVPLFVAALIFLIFYPLSIILGYSITLYVAKIFEWKSRHFDTDQKYSVEDVKSKKPRKFDSYAISRNPKPDEGVEEVLKKLTGMADARSAMKEFVKPGEKVFIKVNICGGIPGNFGSCTSKEVAGEVVKLVREAGAGEIYVCDADMVWTGFWHAARNQGWDEWLEDINENQPEEKKVELVNLSETKVPGAKLVNFDFGKFLSNEGGIETDGDVPEDLRNEWVNELIVDADVIISIPTMKTHSLTDVTLGMKNMYGTFPEIDKAKYHRQHSIDHVKGIEKVIYWMNRAFTPNLTIIDGSIGGEAMGPLSSEPVYFQTFVASDDVVVADSIACQLMGYSPMDIDHLRVAHESGLGDASKIIDIEQFQYEYFPHPKDGNWERPYSKVTDLYDRLIYLVLKIPTVPFFFSLVSDFFMYDLSSLPIIGEIMKAILKGANEFLHLLDVQFPRSDGTKVSANMLIWAVVVLASFFTFFSWGYANSSGFYKLNYGASIIIPLLLATRIKTKHFIAILVSAMIVSATVEYVGPSAGLWGYYDSSMYIYAIFSWPLLMTVVLGFAYILRSIIHGLKLFHKLSSGGWHNAPFLATLLLFTLFLILEEYSGIMNLPALLLYLGMAIVGLMCSNRHSLEWNASLMFAGITLGSFAEYMGSVNGLWYYHFGEGIPIFITLAWALNAWAVYGLALFFKVDFAGAFEKSS